MRIQSMIEELECPNEVVYRTALLHRNYRRSYRPHGCCVAAKVQGLYVCPLIKSSKQRCEEAHVICRTRVLMVRVTAPSYPVN